MHFLALRKICVEDTLVKESVSFFVWKTHLSKKEFQINMWKTQLLKYWLYFVQMTHLSENEFIAL